MADINKYTAKEALNKVIYNNASINTYALSEGLNTVLDDANDRLNIRLEGGTVDGSLIITGGLTVEGATTVIESTTLSIDDKNIDLASTDTPSDATADGGGITLKGTSDKTILWDNTNDNWTFNQAVNIATGLDYKINNTSVLNATTLGSGVTASSLTSVGTLTGLSVASSNQVPLNSYSSGSNSYLVTQVQESQNNVAGIAFSVGNTAISSTASANSHALIQGIVTNSGSALTGELAFWTNGGDSNAERMRIDSDGNVGIGCEPEGVLHVHGGDSGSSYTADGADKFILENNESTAIDIRTPASNQGLILFSDDTRGAGLIGYNHSNDSLRFANSGNFTRMSIDSSGNVGIGDTSPDAHLDVEDVAINTTGTYYGIISRHTKTAGATNNTDDMYGLVSNTAFDDGDAYFGGLYGLYVTGTCIESAGESTALYGAYVEAQIVTSGDVGNVYGIRNKTNIDAGTVRSNVYGQRIEVDVESGCTLSNWVHGLDIDMDVDTDPAGDGVALRVKTNGNYTNWAFLHENSGDNEIKFDIDGDGYWDGVGDSGTASDYAEYFESTDGSVIPIGNTVVLESGKVRQAADGETPMGIIRPHDGCALVGNSAWSKWQEKYLRDDYDARIKESYTKTKWSEEITFDEYVARGKDETGGSMGGQVKDKKVEGSKAIEAKDAVEAVEAQDAVYETVTKQLQKVVVSEVEEEVSSTEIVLEDGKYVQKTTTETVTKEVETPQYEEVTLYDEDGEEIGTHQVPIMEDYEEDVLVSKAVTGVVGIAAVEAVDAVPDTYFREHKYHSDRIPEGLEVPEDAEVFDAGQRRKLNPDFDESFEYVPREERDEWHIVGLLGQIPITKGQPVSDNWIKMSDVSDTVEMYFVK